MSDYINRAAEVLEVHEVVFIDHEVGYECGCNEHGDGHPDGLPFLTDALKHQVRALDAAGLLATPEHDAAVAAAWLRAVKVQVENAKSIILKTSPAASSEWQHGHDAGSHVAIDAVIEMIDAVIAEDVPEREGGDDA